MVRPGGGRVLPVLQHTGGRLGGGRPPREARLLAAAPRARGAQGAHFLCRARHPLPCRWRPALPGEQSRGAARDVGRGHPRGHAADEGPAGLHAGPHPAHTAAGNVHHKGRPVHRGARPARGAGDRDPLVHGAGALRHARADRGPQAGRGGHRARGLASRTPHGDLRTPPGWRGAGLPALLPGGHERGAACQPPAGRRDVPPHGGRLRAGLAHHRSDHGCKAQHDGVRHGCLPGRGHRPPYSLVGDGRAEEGC
mmetsp:Transcript_108815/g.307717  ORF Transcript_108815/g.307717 Transcript_108815/m.307717 type:complete len:253 (+) Transcript_108815:830-1588(+)